MMKWIPESGEMFIKSTIVSNSKKSSKLKSFYGVVFFFWRNEVQTSRSAYFGSKSAFAGRKADVNLPSVRVFQNFSHIHGDLPDHPRPIDELRLFLPGLHLADYYTSRSACLQNAEGSFLCPKSATPESEHGVFCRSLLRTPYPVRTTYLFTILYIAPVTLHAVSRGLKPGCRP